MGQAHSQPTHYQHSKHDDPPVPTDYYSPHQHESPPKPSRIYHSSPASMPNLLLSNTSHTHDPRDYPSSFQPPPQKFGSAGLLLDRPSGAIGTGDPSGHPPDIKDWSDIPASSTTPISRRPPPSAPISASSSSSSLTLSSFRRQHRRAYTHHLDSSPFNQQPSLPHSLSTNNLFPIAKAKYFKLKKLPDHEPNLDDSISLPSNVKQGLHVEYDPDLNKFRGVPRVWHNQFRPYGFTDECLDHHDSLDPHIAPVAPATTAPTENTRLDRTGTPSNSAPLGHAPFPEYYDSAISDLYKINMTFNDSAFSLTPDPPLHSDKVPTPSSVHLDYSPTPPRVTTKHPPGGANYVPSTRSRLSEASGVVLPEPTLEFPPATKFPKEPTNRKNDHSNKSTVRQRSRARTLDSELVATGPFHTNRRPSSPAVLRTPLVPIAPRPPTSLSSLSQPLSPIGPRPPASLPNLDTDYTLEPTPIPPLPPIPDSLISRTSFETKPSNTHVRSAPAGESLPPLSNSNSIPAALSTITSIEEEEPSNHPDESPKIHPLLVTMIESNNFRPSPSSKSVNSSSGGGGLGAYHGTPIGAQVPNSLATLSDILAQASASPSPSATPQIALEEVTDPGDPTTLFIHRQLYAEASRGTVYSAQDATISDARVVIKLIPATDPWVIHELVILRQARHVNIVPFIGAWLDPGSQKVWIVSELYNSGSLADMLEQGACHEPLQCAMRSRPVISSILAPVVSALHYLHTRVNVIHGDLRSDHILLAPDGRIGLAPHWRSAVKIGSLLTTTDQPVFWMTPEVAMLMHGSKRGVRASPQMDVWAFAVTVLELVSLGKYPDEDEDTTLARLLKFGLPTDVCAKYTADPLVLDLFERCTAATGPLGTKSIVDHDLVRDWDSVRARGHLRQIIFLATTAKSPSLSNSNFFT